MSEEEKTTEAKQVSEIVEPIIAEGQSQSLEEFVETLEKLKAKHSTSVYKEFEVSAVQQRGAGVLLLYGKRDETSQERQEREAREERERKTIEATELKEYLRLKKKYGKREE